MAELGWMNDRHLSRILVAVHQSEGKNHSAWPQALVPSTQWVLVSGGKYLLYHSHIFITSEKMVAQTRSSFEICVPCVISFLIHISAFVI